MAYNFPDSPMGNPKEIAGGTFSINYLMQLESYLSIEGKMVIIEETDLTQPSDYG